MFNPARWWNEKNKIKTKFKLQFHASQLPQIGGDGLIVSIVPGDTAKPTVKSDLAVVRDGRCCWEHPLYETVKFIQDPKSGRIHERIYYFVVSTASSKAGVGEASIDLSSYAEATKASSVSLPLTLRNLKIDALLHVLIQRIQESMEQREVEKNENTDLYLEDPPSVRQQFNNRNTGGAIRIICDEAINKTVPHVTELNADRPAPSGSDVTVSSSESSSEMETPWELQMKNDSILQDPAEYLSSTRHHELKRDAPEPMLDEHRSWEWLGNSAPETSTDDSSGTPMEASPGQQPDETPEIKKLKSEVSALSQQAEMSELELQTLRKQIVKETKRGHNLWREAVCLREERDALNGECEQLKGFQRQNDGSKMKTGELFNAEAIVEELRQELNHAKELNANLRIQLQKTQDSNSELLLAVQDLENMLEQKNKELPNQPNGLLTNALDEDDEQKALEELVREHSGAKEVYLLERQITNLHGEIEIYKRDKDELEIQMEQLALDYEIVNQENHDLSFKLKQSQIQERLKMQYECSNELEIQIENLENELKRQYKCYEDSLVTIKELEDHAKSMEEELEKHTRGFEADLENITQAKIEQEQRAIRAEKTLKNLHSRNAVTAERLQDEFRKLTLQMASTFEANEKLAAKAMAEANELRSQKYHLEEMLEKVSEENQSVKREYEVRLGEVTSQVTLMVNDIEQMQLEIEERTVQMQDQKQQAEESQKLFSDEIFVLKEEIEMHITKNNILVEEMGRNETLVHELEETRRSLKEMELAVEQANVERIEMESQAMLMKNEAREMHEELNKMRPFMKEKELIVGKLKSELENLQTRPVELEKENLRKQIYQLTSDVKKTDDALRITKKKINDGNGRGNPDVRKVAPRASKSLPHGSKDDVENLMQRIKLLEGQIKLKDTALERSADMLLEKEKDFHSKIAELEHKVETLNKSNNRSALFIESNIIDGLSDETTLMKERNAAMEGELKEMQERYSEISLKFAEVEGERQQLVMELRNLKNSNKIL